MGNAFEAGLNNEKPHGRDVTVEDREIEESHNGAFNVGLEVKSEKEPRRGRPASPPVRRSLFGEESLEDARREASLRSTDFSSPTLMLTSPLDSAYGTERKTPSCCPVEPDATTPDEAGTALETAKTWKTAKKREQKEDASSIRTSPQQRTKAQKQLIYGTSEDFDSEEKRTPKKTPTKRTSRKKKTLQKKRSIKKTEAEEDSGPESSPSSEDEELSAMAKPKQLLKPPKFDGVKPFGPNSRTVQSTTSGIEGRSWPTSEIR